MGDAELPLLLVIDDEEVLHDTVRVAAESRYRVDSARDGFVGLKMIRAMRPAAVVLDLDMPRMDGRSVLKMVRRDPSLSGTAIAVVSASSMDVALQTTAELGSDLYFEKPTPARTIVDRLSALVGERDLQGASELRQLMKGLDPSVRREVLVTGEAAARADAVRQLDGIAALRLAESPGLEDARARLAAGPLPHSVVADVGDDVAGGLELLASVRALTGGGSLPVHLVASRYEQDELERALNLGVTSFLVKPLRGADLAFAVCGALRAAAADP